MKGALTHIQATCFHEAGHAVMTLYAGRELLGVAVSREQPGNGVCLRRRGQRARLHVPWAGPGSAQAAWLESLEAIQADIRIALAGPLAEARALGKPLRSLGAKSDLDTALRLTRRAEDLSSMMQSYGPVKPLSGQEMLNSLRRQTRAIVGRPLIWRMITILAQTLEREPVLNGTRVHELIGLVGPQDELRGLRMVQGCTGWGARRPRRQDRSRRR
jgi:hypothetical protein